MNTISFQPWVGDAFTAAKLGKRILVLGDSHYEWNGSGKIDQWTAITKTLVQEQIDGDYTKRFWTNIAIMFLNKRPTPEDKREFWHSVAFYNYLQSSAGFGPSSIPVENQWKSSEPAFLEVLSTLQPELLVVLGNRLWNHLPTEHRHPGLEVPGSPGVNTYRYTYPEGSCLALHVRHPGRAFNGQQWHGCLMNALKVA